MTSLEIKRKLIREIDLSTNDKLLEELYRFLDKDNRITEVFKLNDDQKKAVREARDQAYKGDYLTNDQANEEMDKWLKN